MSEIKVLFPAVEGLALSRNVFCSVEGSHQDTVNLAIINMNSIMPTTEHRKLEAYLEVRSGIKPIFIVNSNKLGITESK